MTDTVFWEYVFHCRKKNHIPYVPPTETNIPGDFDLDNSCLSSGWKLLL